MKFVQTEFRVATRNRNEMVNITGQVVVFCPHTTAAITINENADPDVPHDILLTLDALLPQSRSGYRHCEGNSDSHCKCSLVGASELILIHKGRMTLGTWQGIFFCEFDGPRSRKVIVQVRGE